MRKGVVNMLGASLAFSFYAIMCKIFTSLTSGRTCFFRSLVSIQHLYSNDEKTKT